MSIAPEYSLAPEDGIAPEYRAEGTSPPVGAVTAVRTTGIYCRAGCVARPLPANTVVYPNPVAAETAGFRPCLRCRPELEPPLLPEGFSEGVARALVMISDGYLDDHAEAGLAARLGYSARHLRRVFLAEVGATPAQVARSRRAHFARRLLDESDLTVTDIAFAAGFRSVRQMNRVMADTFRFPPSELRRRGRRGRGRGPAPDSGGSPDSADGGLSLRIPYRGRLDFGAMAAYLGSRAIPGVENVSPGDGGLRYFRTVELCGSPGAIEVTAGTDGQRGGHLAVTAHLPTFASLIDLVAGVRRLFGLDEDHRRAVAALAGDELLGPLVAEAPGWRYAGAFDGFETAVRIVVGQQISVAGASTMTGRLALLGPRVEGLGRLGLERLFPGPETLARADLAGMGFTGGRIRTLAALSSAVADGSLVLERGESVARTRDVLLSLPGVGPWTTELIAMRVLGDPDAFPASDLGLRKGFAALVGASSPVPAAELQQAAERWRPHRSLAAAHLWRAAARASGVSG